MLTETTTKYTLTREEVIKAIELYIEKETGSKVLNIKLILPFDEDGNYVRCEGATAEKFS
jgi:hypothetical protein